MKTVDISILEDFDKQYSFSTIQIALHNDDYMVLLEAIKESFYRVDEWATLVESHGFYIHDKLVEKQVCPYCLAPLVAVTDYEYHYELDDNQYETIIGYDCPNGCI